MNNVFTQPLSLYLKLAVIPLIASLIGWITNVIAIKLIFRPINPVRIPILNITLQGIIPKRRKTLARSIAEVIDHELVSFGEVIEEYIKGNDLHEIKESIIQGILHITGRKIPAFIYSAFESPLENYVRDFFNTEGDELLKELVIKYTLDAGSKISLVKMVEEKINGFDMGHLERIITGIAGKELKSIERLGALLGLVIGIFQSILLLIL